MAKSYKFSNREDIGNMYLMNYLQGIKISIDFSRQFSVKNFPPKLIYILYSRIAVIL